MENIGLQLFSVREQAEKDLPGTLRQLGDFGYKSVQFAGFFTFTPEEIRSALDEKGMKPAGAHVGIDLLLGDNFEKTLRQQETIGNNLIICPALPKEMRSSREEYLKTADTLNEIGEKCRQAGFTFGYHNHDFEFETFDGTTGFDLLFENTDSALVKMELDCFWAEYAGYDPRDLMNKYADRCLSLHLKDLATKGDKKVSTTIGAGELDLNDYVQVGKGNGVDWFVIEQEDFEGDPMELAAANLDSLLQIIEK
ncbi:sugar phosphate isomerase/epimerase family protein [Thalassobacillus pellis]|uniref:sugar phosphate isomerase/epimerase family protein n=1 Tax=Thalassobacillus pellis TaxID=748008 RepID=UPI0019619AA5|nr:sugar phosphate isomerase/epimerase [Thalassobacillus pellis]MBM7551534.1 sugar phosphate isomerase/epimerase [Thalassobacillus pellis]